MARAQPTQGRETALSLVDEPARPLVAAAWDDPEGAALTGLRELPPAALAKLVPSFAAHPQRAVRRALVGLVRDHLGKRWAGHLVGLLADGEEPVRLAAQMALKKLQAVSVADQVAELLGHPDPGVRATALGALGFLDPERIGARMTALLADPAPEIRAQAVRAVGATRLELLAPLLADPDPRVREMVVAVLPGWREDCAPCAAHPDPGVRVSALELFRKGGFAPDRPPPPACLEPLEQDPDPGVRAAAAELFGWWRERTESVARWARERAEHEARQREQARATWLSDMRAVLPALARALPRIEAALAPHRRTAWLPLTVEGDSDPAGSKLGGRPWVGAEAPWPTCGRCGHLQTFLLQLRGGELPARAGRLQPGELLQLFVCGRGCGRARTRQPFSDAHTRRLVRPEGDPAPPPEGVKTLAARMITGWRDIDDYPDAAERRRLGASFALPRELRERCLDDDNLEQLHAGVRPELEPALASAGLDVARLELADQLLASPRGWDKLLGWPRRERGAVRAECPRCGAELDHLFQLGIRMGKVLQVDGEPVIHLPLEWVIQGTALLSQCPTHREVLGFTWGGS